jgi:serine/threonine protein kinase
MPLEPGQVVDQYRLDQTIHRGRATIVYAATDVGLGRKVAFKVLAERYVTDDVVRQRFVNEAQVAASLDGHPHIVTVYKWGEFEGSMYFVTELIDGISLAELLDRQPGGRPLQPNEALGLLAQIADALDFAHKRGAIHRDVKPANVMVKMTDTPRTAYLVDFGITKMDDGETGPQGMFLGTPDYASPEQISGAQALDRRSDVYSLACTAFEILVGRPPFGDAPNDAARIAAHLQSPIPSARTLRNDLPPEVDRIFAKALAKNREDRYGTCGEFVRELRAAFPEGTHIFRRPPPPGADLPTPALYTPDMAPRRKWPWVVVAVAFAVLATTVAYFVTSRRDPGISVSQGPELTTTTSTTTTTTSTTSTTTTTTTTTSTTTTAPPTTAPGPFGPIGPPVTAGESPAAAYAVGVQARRPGAEIAAPGSPAMLYAEWARLVTRGEPGSRQVRSLQNDGFLVEVDEQVALRNVRLNAGSATDVRECRADRACAYISDRILRVEPCEPAPGCPTVDSDRGVVRAAQVANLLIREPQQNVIYELQTEQEITRISEPGGHIFWDTGSDYFVLQLGGIPDVDTTLRLTLTFADGTTDRMTMNFNVPTDIPTAGATTTTSS